MLLDLFFEERQQNSLAFAFAIITGEIWTSWRSPLVANTTTLLTLITTGACAAQIKAGASTEAALWTSKQSSMLLNQYRRPPKIKFCNYLQKSIDEFVALANLILKARGMVLSFGWEARVSAEPPRKKSSTQSEHQQHWSISEWRHGRYKHLILTVTPGSAGRKKSKEERVSISFIYPLAHCLFTVRHKNGNFLTHTLMVNWKRSSLFSSTSR